MTRRVAIVGAGIFGASAALELARRGDRVTLIDPGPVPHEDAASTDISKIVRLDYGDDELYTELMEGALERWRALNERWPRPMFHETGFVLLSSKALAPGSFELESLRVLERRGHSVQRLDEAGIAERFPAWRTGRYVDGYYNAQGGWAQSGAVSAWFSGAARDAGATLCIGAAVDGLIEGDGGVGGVRLADGSRVAADETIVAAGAWTAQLVPELRDALPVVGQPVLHFRPTEVERFAPPAFVPWAADIAETGWYGFCANADGVVKVANHGPGKTVDPRGERKVDAAAESKFRAFLEASLPGLVDAPCVFTRLCLYCDSFDGDLWITRHPERAGLAIAAGGSGHGFKLAPVLGELIADELDAKRRVPRFGWRMHAVEKQRFEAARFEG